ncbi:MAG TPA: 3-dehydroquinate synthase [Rhodospirillaceae bacterium]|nr:3-dehydroquinate synthase [Rhodospirillaceae bacterium]
MTHQTVPIALPATPRAYNIHVGEALIAHAGEMIRREVGLRRFIIVTETNVAPLYLSRLETALTTAGHRIEPSIILPAGEGTKSFASLEGLLAQLFGRKVDRHTTLIALGGGVIGDLTGFAASITLRGVDFIQIPTTLLAQVDSSVGGKTGINSAHGKNTIGTFYQPRLVLADVDALDTLRPRDLLSGYGEVVKYGLIHNADFFAWCETNAAALLKGDKAALKTAVTKSCLDKAAIVAADEREAGPRALLNLGHTFGHALESVTGFSDALLHGESVAIGTAMAFSLSTAMGLCPAKDTQAVYDHFKACGLPTTPPALPSGKPYDIDELMALMAQDKKAKDGKLTLILTRGIGQCFIAPDVDPDPVQALWEKTIKGG